jgi:ribose/xylose/arabinose/galactoside ABC-type transport system permease subunit
MSTPSRASVLSRVSESKVLFPLIALALILLFDLLAVPGFFNLETVDGHLFGNLVDIPRNGSTTMLLALGMTLVIATGGIDLSVGAVMAISAAVAALLSSSPSAWQRCAGHGTASSSRTPASSRWSRR